MKKIAKRFASVILSIVMILSVSLTSVDAKGLDSNITQKKAIDLLKKYDPDGAYIIDMTLKYGNDISIWLLSGEYLERVLDTLVHEECHNVSFTNVTSFNSESIYIGGGKDIKVEFTPVYESSIMAKTIPSNLRTSRYYTYVGEPEYDMASNKYGVYGLLNEFTAYCWGMNNTVNMFEHYKTLDVTPEVWLTYASSGASTRLAYVEFKYFILKYMDYAKKNYPSMYKEIMNNRNFLKAYAAIEKKYSNVNAQFIKNLNAASKLLNDKGYDSEIRNGLFWVGRNGQLNGQCLFEENYNQLKNEIKKYSAIDTAMKNKASGKLSTPVITSVKNDVSGAKITWKKVNGAVKYRVFRKNNSGKWVSVGTTTGTSFVDKKALSGKKNTYTVRCISKDGKSNKSDYNKTGKSVVYYKAPVISKLTNSKAGVSIKWNKVAGVGKYKIFRKEGNGSWKYIGTTKSTSFVDKNAKSGKKYTYTVKNVDSTGKKYLGAYSKVGKSITRYAQPVLKSVRKVDDGLKITWGKVNGAAKYKVLRKNSNGKWVSIGIATGDSFIDKNVKNNEKHTYTVRCLDKNGTTYVSSYDAKGISGVFRK